ncbi:hypothetical protein SAMN02990966_03431 [Rhodospirillales bacterium URHD0017]|nr:hypothetical protein SAMN02990966_03431 [Rhodospirillales bacterium URHD0017]
MAIRPGEQLAERRQGSGRHDIGFGRRRLFDTADDDPWRFRQGHAPGGLSQECGLAGIGLDQGHVEIRTQRRKDQAGKPAAAAQIGKAFGLGRYQRG